MCHHQGSIDFKRLDRKILIFNIFWLLIWWFSRHEMLDGWIIIAFIFVLNVIRDRSITVSLICVPPPSYFQCWQKKVNIKGISVTRVVTAQVQPWELISSLPTNMPVFQLCAFHIIFIILQLSLEIENFLMIRVWLSFRAFPYPTIYICLSISYQLCYKTKLFPSSFTSMPEPIL